MFDIVLIDCPPGLSVLTESWLREADFHLSPTKADYVSVCGLEVFRRFKALNPEMGFAENMGVIVNMKDAGSAAEDDYHGWIRDNAENNVLQAGRPARGGPAGGGTLPCPRPIVFRQVPRPDGPCDPRADRGASPAHGRPAAGRDRAAGHSGRRATDAA